LANIGVSGSRADKFNEASRVQMPTMASLLWIDYAYFGKISEEMAGKAYDHDTNILLDIFMMLFKILNLNEKGKTGETLRMILQKLDNDDLECGFYKRLTGVSPFSQDISQRRNKINKLNLILNGLITWFDHVIQGDPLLSPYHKSNNGKELRQFDFVVSNPPFKMEFLNTRGKKPPCHQVWCWYSQCSRKKEKECGDLRVLYSTRNKFVKLHRQRRNCNPYRFSNCKKRHRGKNTKTHY
jgi:hypothetical protein